MIFFVSYATSCSPHQTCKVRYNTITTEEFNVDSKAEYSTLSSTRREKKHKKKKLKQTNAVVRMFIL